MTKTYILDISALIEDPDIFYRSADAYVIPAVVLKEIDGLKRSDVEHIAQAARKVGRTLDRLSSYGDLAAGVKLSTGGVLRVVSAYDPVNLLASDADNKVIGTALRLKRELGNNVILLTTDANMRTAARVSGVQGEVMGSGEAWGKKGEAVMDKYRMEVERLKGRGRKKELPKSHSGK